MLKKRAHVFISGSVQGVFFRSDTVDNAVNFNLTGWVKNSWDGRVEAIFEGEKENIDEMIKWCNSGPTAARVDRVEVLWENYTGEYNSFSVDY